MVKKVVVHRTRHTRRISYPVSLSYVDYIGRIYIFVGWLKLSWACYNSTTACFLNFYIQVQLQTFGHLWVELQTCTLPWGREEDSLQSIWYQVHGNCPGQSRSDRLIIIWYSTKQFREIWPKKCCYQYCCWSWTHQLHHHVLWLHPPQLCLWQKNSEDHCCMIFLTKSL